MNNRIDNDLLMSWCNMETMDEYLGRKGAFDIISNEEFLAIAGDYFAEVDKRIKQCEELLDGDNKFLIYYTLAELYSRFDMDELPGYPNKRKACHYAIKAIREDRSFAPAWALLAEVYSWAVYCGGIEGVAKYLVDQGMGVFKDENDETNDKKSYLTDEYKLANDQKKRIKLIEKSIFCMKKALAIDPSNENYSFLLTGYRHQRNEEYKPLHVHRNSFLER